MQEAAAPLFSSLIFVLKAKTWLIPVAGKLSGIEFKKFPKKIDLTDSIKIGKVPRLGTSIA